MTSASADRLRILVTGANGQLGRELALWDGPGADSCDIRGCGRDELDITDLTQCRAVMQSFQPHAVIHCAAYTAVDQAESDIDGAFRVNAAGTRNVALAAREVGAKLAYVSTDYVFDGTSEVPYNEYDIPNPRTIYGKSKLAGEHMVSTLHDRYFIVRTSWVYGPYGANFVKTMLKVGPERGAVKVVHDQLGSPTYTADLAAMLLELVHTDAYGIYHASNSGTCSWYEFAVAIFEEQDLLVKTDPCTTAEFPRPAPRPAFSVMDHCSIRVNGLTPMRGWREALREYLSRE